MWSQQHDARDVDADKSFTEGERNPRQIADGSVAKYTHIQIRMEKGRDRPGPRKREWNRLIESFHLLITRRVCVRTLEKQV